MMYLKIPVLLVLIIVIIILSIINAYGLTNEIIDFSKPDDINKFTFGFTGPNYASIAVKDGKMYFSGSEWDYFAYAYLPLGSNVASVSFDLQSIYSYYEHSKTGNIFDGGKYAFQSFTVEFSDGTNIKVYYNYDSTAFSEDTYMDKFIVKSLDGSLNVIGNGVDEANVNYTVSINSNIITIKSSKGHTYSENIGDKIIKDVKFDPLAQWYLKNGVGYLDNIVISYKQLVSSIFLAGSSTVEKGNTISISASILPTDVINKNLTWTSNDLNIAEVDGVGGAAIVRGIKKGTVTITATAQDGSGVKGTKVITVTSSFSSSEAKYTTVDDFIKYQTGYSDTEKDPKFKDEYKYIHNPYLLNGVTLDNNMGFAGFADQWTDIAYTQFPKVGTYKVQYRVQDNPPATQNNVNFYNYRYYSDYVENTIYVHRKPIALYSINASAVTDSSYDLDHSVSHASKGIDKWEWQYVNSNGLTNIYTASTKADGVNKVNSWLSTYGSTVQYKIILRVRDIEGAWSEPCIKAAGEISKPVADFTIEKNPMIYKADTQKITDMSYDTNGLSLSYQWSVEKGGQAVLNSSNKDISSSLNQTINNLYPNITGKYNVSLKVINSAGVESNTVVKSFDVIVHNQAPAVDFNLVSNESPAWVFPKILGVHNLKFRPSNSLFYEENSRFNVNITDPNPDNTGFIYNWKLERFGVKNIDSISGAADNIYSYTAQYPFTSSFKNQGLGWGAYKVTLKVTDKPPVPPYQAADVKTAEISKYYYIIPELSLTGSFESERLEVVVGDTIKAKAKTNKVTENVSCTFDGIRYTLEKVFEDSEFAYWEKNIKIPESITESGTYNLTFTGSTTYGGNGSITREVKDVIPIEIIALKLTNFRITNIVNHPDVTFPYTKDMLMSQLIEYKTGYYVTFRIDSKGKPDNVYGRIDVGNNGSIEEIINMTKVASGDLETWEGKFYTVSSMPEGTIISIKTDCKKGPTIYDYNLKESWDGRSLIINGSALMDGRINLTN